MINDNATDQIKSKLSIVDLISEYIQVTKQGAGFKALCPFHNEKTPSFHVSEERQTWHCFGCSLGGDIFDFVMRIEGVEFKEALKLLAPKAGVKLTFQNNSRENKKSRLYDINEEAALFFHDKFLKDSEACHARDYVNKRGVNQESIKDFCFGYSPSNWGDLRDYLIKKGYSEQEINDAGLIIKSRKTNRYYDRFRNRLMFPIRNVFGNVVGFSARILDPSQDKMGKYINTSATSIYNKSAVLYGLYRAKDEIKKSKKVVFVEGQMDVVSCHQAGIKNVVATSGTALTKDHIILISRYADVLCLCFDADNAGKIALLRAVKEILPTGIDCRVIDIIGGKDPDELISKNPSAFVNAVAQAVPVMDFYFEKVLVKASSNNAMAKKKAADFIKKILLLIPSEVVKAHYLSKMASVLGVNEKALREEFENLKIKKTPNISKPEQLRNKDKVVVLDEESALFERIFAIILRDPLFWKQLPIDFSLYLDKKTLYLEVYNVLESYYNGKDGNYHTESNEISELFTDSSVYKNFIEKVFLLGESLYSDFSSSELESEFDILCKRVGKDYLSGKISVIQQELSIAEKNKDTEKVNQIVFQMNEYTAKRQALQ